MSHSRKRSNRKSRCQKLLSRKISINMKEKRYKSRAQAIAVAYAQVRKKHPSCRRVLKKSSRKRTSRKR